MKDYADRYESKGKRKCRICGTSKGLIRVYGIYLCRRCFREHARELGFEKYS